MARILADPDPNVRSALARVLAAAAPEVTAADSLATAVASLDAAEFDLVLAELDLPGGGGMKLLDKIVLQHPGTAVVLSSAFGSVRDAVQAMRAGAADFLAKPFADDQLQVALDRALEKNALRRENHELRSALDDRLRLDNLVGSDPRMQSIFKTVKAVADTRTTVLITGESGTGKTLLARALHSLSSRRGGPFVEVNCGALPETLLESELFGHVRGSFTGASKDKIGKFEAAAGGTIFLDEIGTSSPAFQIKLLRVLQDRIIERVGDTRSVPVDVRIVLATNLDLEQAVKAGTFREDLYYRIHVVVIEMPPLRARTGDIGDLAVHFLQRFCHEHGRPVTGFTKAAMQHLLAAPWPGNVRQLENVVERAVVLAPGPLVDVGDLPTGISRLTPPAAEAAAVPVDGPVGPLKDALAGPERQLIERALRQCDGNRERAARLLAINRSTLFHKLRKYGIKGAGSRG